MPYLGMRRSEARRKTQIPQAGRRTRSPEMAVAARTAEAKGRVCPLLLLKYERRVPYFWVGNRKTKWGVVFWRQGKRDSRGRVGVFFGRFQNFFIKFFAAAPFFSSQKGHFSNRESICNFSPLRGGQEDAAAIYRGGRYTVTGNQLSHSKGPI